MANLSSKTGTITTPVQTQISLANNATTSVQDMSAYDAQEVMGFVYVDATADLRAYFTVTVVKNGAGTYEIAGADVAGDQSGTGSSAVAPISFSMSGSILQVTVPNLAGFTSGYLRYQLSAPYLGGNYPLTVSATQVAGNAAGTVAAAGYIGEEILASRTTSFTITSPVINTLYDITNLSLTLTPGIWAISFNGGVIRGFASTNNFVAGAALRDGSNTSLAYIESTSNGITTANSVSLAGLNLIYRATSSTTIKLSGGVFQTSGSAPTSITADFTINVGGISSALSAVTMKAVRIA